jgi:hypothetical protein
MKKHLLTAMMLIFILYPLSAQKSKDVLYLKNGSQVFGKLIEITDNQYKIQTSSDTVFIFPGTEVEKFVSETSITEGRKKNGSGFALEAGVLAGAQDSKYDAAFSFNFVGSLTRNTFDSFGLGSGVEFLGQSFMPIFLEYRHLISGKKTTPYIFMRGGKLIHLSGDYESTDQNAPIYNTPTSYKGGFSLTLGIGISWIKDNYESYLSFAYRNAHTSYDELDYSNQTYTYKNVYNRVEIKYGFRF